MDNINIKLHEFQKLLLKKLATTPSLRFNELLIAELESEHMNYHLKKLVGLGLVKKKNSIYSLTDAGKDYSSLMDDEVELIEKQPKTSVLLHAVRQRASGDVEHLLSRRLRQPYFGKVGRLTGKVRFGESLQEAAARELYEETGLTAKTMALEAVYHKRRQRPDGTFVQDNLFYRFFVTDFSGALIARTPHQENLWVASVDPIVRELDLFEAVDLSNRFEPTPFEFSEDLGIATGY